MWKLLGDSLELKEKINPKPNQTKPQQQQQKAKTNIKTKRKPAPKPQMLLHRWCWGLIHTNFHLYLKWVEIH